jgi:hypothetical protein
MSSSGTLLTDLDSGGSNDNDIIAEIMADMNGGGAAAPPPPMPSAPPAPMINAPNPNTYAPRAMDAAPATAHIIGREHPTMADFQQALNSVPYHAPPPPMGYGAPYQQQQYQQPPPPRPPKKSFLQRVMGELRQPFFVILLFFVLNLPVINFLFAHYIPRLVKPTGDLTIVGLLVKSTMAGSIFWFVNRILMPLLSF